MINNKFNIYLTTNLPKSEFYIKINNFAISNGIKSDNIIFMTPQMKAKDFVIEYKVNWYFTDNEFEIADINQGKDKIVACYMSNQKNIIN